MRIRYDEKALQKYIEMSKKISPEAEKEFRKGLNISEEMIYNIITSFEELIKKEINNQYKKNNKRLVDFFFPTVKKSIIGTLIVNNLKTKEEANMIINNVYELNSRE